VCTITILSKTALGFGYRLVFERCRVEILLKVSSTTSDFFFVFPSPFWHLKLRHQRLLSHPFQFIIFFIYLSFYNSTLYSATSTASLNEEQSINMIKFKQRFPKFSMVELRNNFFYIPRNRPENLSRWAHFTYC
jgi:hypothetical protein